MAKKSKKRKAFSLKNHKKNLAKHFWRLFIVLGLPVAGVTVAIVASAVHGPKTLDARGTADVFFNAVTECDSAGIKKYDALVAANNVRILEFESTCKPGEAKVTFVKDFNDGITQFVDGEATQTHNFAYQFVENGKKAEVVVEMAKNGPSDPWQVWFLSGFPIFQ